MFRSNHEQSGTLSVDRELKREGPPGEQREGSMIGPVNVSWKERGPPLNNGERSMIGPVNVLVQT